jgi:dihydroorotate dehydrogenase electron transfer subunit
MQAIILSNRQVLPTYYRMSLRVAGLSPAFTPGQFVMVRPSAVGDPILPRAFSIMRAAPARPPARAQGCRGAAAQIEIVYRALGRGTTLMAALGRGNTMDVLGPLGQGFRPALGPAVFVAGGVGVPPIVALAEHLAPRLASRRTPPRQSKILNPQSRIPLSPQSSVLSPRPLVLIGGRTKEDVLGVSECRRAGCAVQVATDDGSVGHHGMVTDLLEAWIARAANGRGNGSGRGGGAPPATIYACGPEGMLRAVRRITLGAGLPCQLCLEANMACGFGGCMGCAIPVMGEGMAAYKLCCKDGPVFEAKELRW